MKKNGKVLLYSLEYPVKYELPNRPIHENFKQEKLIT